MVSESTEPKATQGYPLGAVFLLIAIVACIIVQFNFGKLNTYPREEIAYAAAWGAFFGLLFGAIIGLYHYRRAHGLFLGCGVGTLVGAATGPICYLGIRSPWPMVISACVGAAGLICFAMIYRHLNSSDPIANFAAYNKLLPEGGTTNGTKNFDVQGIPANLLERAIAAAVVCPIVTGLWLLFVPILNGYFGGNSTSIEVRGLPITQSIAVICGCFLLVGLPAILYSRKALKHRQNGVPLQANYAANQAMTWIRISVGYLLAAIAIGLCLVVVGYLKRGV